MFVRRNECGVLWAHIFKYFFIHVWFRGELFRENNFMSLFLWNLKDVWKDRLPFAFKRGGDGDDWCKLHILQKSVLSWSTALNLGRSHFLHIQVKFYDDKTLINFDVTARAHLKCLPAHSQPIFTHFNYNCHRNIFIVCALLHNLFKIMLNTHVYINLYLHLHYRNSAK